MSKEDILNRIPARWGKYLDVGPGWYPIVFKLDKDLAALDPNYTIAQVKEKFGGLRYYLDTINSDSLTAARELISAAELEASITCDECSSPGELRFGNYYATRCEAHAP